MVHVHGGPESRVLRGPEQSSVRCRVQQHRPCIKTFGSSQAPTVPDVLLAAPDDAFATKPVYDSQFRLNFIRGLLRQLSPHELEVLSKRRLVGNPAAKVKLGTLCSSTDLFVCTFSVPRPATCGALVPSTKIDAWEQRLDLAKSEAPSPTDCIRFKGATNVKCPC